MTYEIITNDDLEKFRLQLLEDLKTFLRPAQQTKEWLKNSEVRKMLGISHGTLQNLRINRTIPYTKVGSIIFYKREDIIRILEDGVIRK